MFKNWKTKIVYRDNSLYIPSTCHNVYESTVILVWIQGGYDEMNIFGEERRIWALGQCYSRYFCLWLWLKGGPPPHEDSNVHLIGL